MPFQGRSIDEREAASIVAGLHSNNAVAGTTRVGAAAMASGSKKRVRGNAVADEKRAKKKKPAARKPKAKKDPPMDATGRVFAQPELKPAPYFYYTDHSLEQDDDPLTPITAAGSVPTFPAKMHAILTNPELADVVGWAPHGRSWRILKPRDFEIRVLPKYFEHSKFSSFVRQANGWGFRRMSQGYDKNAYYQEYFLRAMPWLCKKMRRPKVAEKKAVDPEMEPHFDAISSQIPVPDRPPTREVLVLQKTIELGPKARMPVLWDTGTPPAAPSSPIIRAINMPVVEIVSEDENLSTLNHNISYGDLKPAALPTNTQALPAPQGAGQVAANTMLSMGNMGYNVQNNVQQFLASSMLPPNTMATSNQNNLNTAVNCAAPVATPNTTNAPPSSLASDPTFAAGFMAATAMHSNQIRNMLSSAFAAGMPIPEAASMVMPPAPVVPVTTANLGNALNLLQRAGMGQNNLNFQPYPVAAAAGAGNFAFNGSSNLTSQTDNLSEHALQRLLQFQAYQAAARGDMPQFPFHPGNP
eukprot:CAMPEP_0172325650 /NCGR_PEP_ID=MMETSP1058-20130122/54473_1 /TAXON_ID=83371 /ORGANISM="Detonula confervacea, Strain CCMP 353" /LENGTH=526 /DNA_ID=CAMNT_0013042241 /DNA_START=159 /DNA_END=1739 /DNA_ORIENTATION=+